MVDVWKDGRVMRPVCKLRPGDRVDLEGDTYADKFWSEESPLDSEHPEFAFEFEVVMEITVETPDCTLVQFESGYACGFPPDHLVDVDGEQIRE